jgi:hypothetical protein
MATTVEDRAAARTEAGTPRSGRLPVPPSYLVVAGALLALVVASAVAGRWGSGDLWEHAAAVRALALDPLHPSHPMLRSGEPSAFFSPYHLVVALFSRATGIGPLGSLATFGILNIALLLVVLPPFVRLFSTRRQAPTLVLLFTLLLWGPRPILWSGFLHLDVIGSYAAFPSTLGVVLAFAGLVGWDRYLRRGSTRWLVLVAIDSAVLALVHPTTEGLFLVGVVALLAGAPVEVVRQRWWSLLVVGGVAAVAAVGWPYFSMVEVVTTYGDRFYASDRLLYDGVLREVAPALLGLVFVAVRLLRRWRDPLVLYLGLLVAELLVGGVTRHWNLGRALPLIVLLLHVALADGLLRWWEEGRPIPRRTFARLAVPIAVVVLALAANNLRSGVLRAVPASVLPDSLQARTVDYQRPWDDYGQALEGVGDRDVVLADPFVAWQVPAFGPKIVWARHAQAFVDDVDQRRRAAERFFARGTSDRDRLAIARRYGARFVLLDDARPVPGVDAPTIARLGHEVRRVGALHLVELRS